MLLALKPPLSRWYVRPAEEDAELDANGPLSEANGLPGLEAEPEASREATETEAPVQEQLRIAQLAKQGLALVEAALSYGQEGADISAFLTPPFPLLPLLLSFPASTSVYDLHTSFASLQIHRQVEGPVVSLALERDPEKA